MRSIYKKIEIKWELLIVFFFALISGLFKDILTFFLVIFVHELGHVTSSLLYGWNIKKISFGICGGFITYDENIDKPFNEEFIISISGFLFQLLFYLFSFLLYKHNVIDVKLMVLIEKYHYSIFLFNLIPIVPLDGFRVISVLLNLFIPYKKSLKITFFISLLVMFVIAIYLVTLSPKIECSYVIIFCFLIKKVISFYKDIPYLFNKFLFERYANPIKSKKTNIINGYYLDKMKRQKINEFIIEKKRYKERQILSKVFD